jgi:chaperone modulatory protein CbpM
MTSSGTVYLQGEIVEESVEFTLSELCRASGASQEQLSLWVAEGAFEPQGEVMPQWRFSGTALRRATRAQRLTRDLELNPAGVALALDLLDEIDALRERLAQLGKPSFATR